MMFQFFRRYTGKYKRESLKNSTRYDNDSYNVARYCFTRYCIACYKIDDAWCRMAGMFAENVISYTNIEKYDIMYAMAISSAKSDVANRLLAG